MSNMRANLFPIRYPLILEGEFMPAKISGMEVEEKSENFQEKTVGISAGRMAPGHYAPTRSGREGRGGRDIARWQGNGFFSKAWYRVKQSE